MFLWGDIMKEVKKEIDKEKLNEVLSLSKGILKILYVVIIIAGIYGLTIINKEWKLSAFVFECISIVAPLFIGFVIAWLFNPLVNKLQKKGVKRIFGASLVYLIFVGLLVLLISLIIPMMSDQINDFVKMIPSVFDSIKNWIDGLFNNAVDGSNIDIVGLKNDIFSKIEIFATGLTEGLPATSINFVKSLFSGLSTFAVGLIIGFFLLVSFDNFNNILSFLPRRLQKDTKNLGDEINDSLRKFVQGTLILSSLVFGVSSLGFLICGLKSPLLFGLFCGITNVIPYVGPYIGGIPAVIVGLSQGPLVGIGVLIVIVIVQFIEGNLLQPIVMSKTMKLHPVTIMLGLLICGHFWGIIGMIVATPIVSTIKIAWNYFDRKYNILKLK
ncbi:MAG: AI-2E family transporter [Firmicutes bacterium]|nr:AI-2E family transporter [Bacillota bacterium]